MAELLLVGNEKNSDLHMHSTASDGGYSPSELINKCADVGLQIIALTDHDTMSGIEAAVKAGKQHGIKVIPGIEFSTKAYGKSIHMLGYGLDWKDEHLNELLLSQQTMRRERLDKIITKLRKVDVQLQPEDVLEFVDGGSIGRPHIAKALIKHGFVNDVAEAFERYLGEGKPCYVEKEREMTPEEAIELIHSKNGIAVLAHPVYYGLDEKIEEWFRHFQLDGVEVYHRDHLPSDVERYENIVDQLEKKYNKKVLKTGGSDFHHEDYGRKKEPLGVTRLENRLAIELLEILDNRNV